MGGILYGWTVGAIGKFCGVIYVPLIKVQPGESAVSKQSFHPSPLPPSSSRPPSNISNFIPRLEGIRHPIFNKEEDSIILIPWNRNFFVSLCPIVIHFSIICIIIYSIV